MELALGTFPARLLAFGRRRYFSRNWEGEKCKDWAVAAYVIAVLTPGQPLPQQKSDRGGEDQPDFQIFQLTVECTVWTRLKHLLQHTD